MADTDVDRNIFILRELWQKQAFYLWVYNCNYHKFEQSVDKLTTKDLIDILAKCPDDIQSFVAHDYENIDNGIYKKMKHAMQMISDSSELLNLMMSESSPDQYPSTLIRMIDAIKIMQDRFRCAINETALDSVRHVE